ncbi:MAG: hypothetical protein WC869_07405 [Phycisphaerae bacterium]|jgi:hypothetical protein
MKHLRSLACVLLSLALVGCYPAERIVWSPDGSRALVIADKVYLCDGNGLLSDANVPLSNDKNIPVIAWCDDSRRVALTGTMSLHDWKDIEPILSEADKTWLTEAAEAIRADILANYADDLGKLVSVADKSGQVLRLARMYLRDRRAEGLAARLGPKWKEFVDATWDVTTLSTAKVTDKGLQVETAIYRSIDRILSVRVSKGSNVIAFTSQRPGKGDMGVLSLWAIPADGSGPAREVASNTSWYFDWTSDGRSLAYAASKTPGSKEGQLGAIECRPVAGADGRLLKDFPAEKPLAGVIFSQLARVRCLADGGMFFSSSEVTLPATLSDMPGRGSVFALMPTAPTVVRVLTRQAEAKIPDVPDLFAVSPDRKRLCIPGGKGEVAVVTLASGEVQELVATPPDGGSATKPAAGLGKLAVIPTWRYPDELCLLVPAGSPYGSPNRPEVVLFASPDKFRCISKGWSDAVIESLTK